MARDELKESRTGQGCLLRVRGPRGHCPPGLLLPCPQPCAAEGWDQLWGHWERQTGGAAGWPRSPRQDWLNETPSPLATPILHPLPSASLGARHAGAWHSSKEAHRGPSKQAREGPPGPLPRAGQLCARLPSRPACETSPRPVPSLRQGMWWSCRSHGRSQASRGRSGSCSPWDVGANMGPVFQTRRLRLDSTSGPQNQWVRS